jgi:DtxR family transcriptional regulator, Mn-dependent transcriptional regulator
MTTQNREDYLRALYVLQEKGQTLRSSDVASYLGVSKPSVSEMVRRLNDEGLIKSAPYAKLHFTPKGKRMAMELTSKHRIIELFLKNVLKRNGSQIHNEAHRLEHAFSNESIAQMRKLMRNPTEDPHGMPIPKVRS